MRKNVHDFLENDVINDDQNSIPISQQMIENVNEDQLLAEELRRRTVMRLSKQRKRGGLNRFKKVFRNDNAEILEEYEGSSPMN